MAGTVGHPKSYGLEAVTLTVEDFGVMGGFFGGLFLGSFLLLSAIGFLHRLCGLDGLSSRRMRPGFRISLRIRSGMGFLGLFP